MKENPLCELDGKNLMDSALNLHLENIHTISIQRILIFNDVPVNKI